MRDTDFQELDLEFIDDEAFLDEPRKDFWQRLSRVMEVLLYILVLVAVARIFWPEVEHQRTLNTELARLEGIQEDHRVRATQLRQEYEWLKNDLGYIESVARDRLNLYRPEADEFIVRIDRSGDEVEGD